jgi:hypothetical protein
VRKGPRFLRTEHSRYPRRRAVPTDGACDRRTSW